MVPIFWNQHPSRDCLQAIGSKHAVVGLPSLADATPVLVGDETTWLDGGLRCRRSKAGRPHKEEKTRAIECDELGVAIDVASSRSGRITPPRKIRWREPKLQGLPERVVTSPCRPKQAQCHPLAAKAGQVDRSCRSATQAAATALGEELGAARELVHPLSNPLATEASRKRRGR
jgi:hypothetical protein